MTLLDDLIAKPPSGEEPGWPPAGHRERIRQQVRWQALARNDREEVTKAWANELGAMVHHDDAHPLYPAPKLASRIMSAFLFGEAAGLEYEEDTAQEALRAWRDDTGLDLVLREGARTASVQGEAYLRPVWDSDLSPWPLLTVIAGRKVIPRFRHRQLVEAVVYDIAEQDDGTVWRLLELHEPGAITTRVYKGDAETLGKATERGAPSSWVDDIEPDVDTGIEQLTLVHVPFDRDSDGPHGLSMFDGTEGLILGLHRLYLQEQHDAELARRRIAAPSSYITRDEAGRARFDRTTDLLELDESAAGTVGAESPIVPIEFGDDLVQRERIQGRLRDFMLACGIAPQTLGEEAGGAQSGTARKLAQTLTIQTVGLAGGYWTHALRRAIPLTLQLGRIHLSPPVSIPDALEDVGVELADGFVDDIVERAQVIATLDAADAISPEQKVRQLHPDWPEDQVREEVAAIREAKRTAVPEALRQPAGLAATIDGERDDDGPPEGEDGDG